MQRSIDVVVDDVIPVQDESQGLTNPSSSEAAFGATGADMLLLMADDGSGLSNDDTAAWTDQIEPGSIQGAVPHHVVDFAPPGTDHVQIVDDLQADTLRVSWS